MWLKKHKEKEEQNLHQGNLENKTIFILDLLLKIKSKESKFKKNNVIFKF